MPRFVTTDTTTTQSFKYDTLALTHDITISNHDNSAMSGSITLSCKKPGGSNFESIANGNIGLGSPHSLLVTGTIAELQIEFSNVSGASKLVITDTMYDRE